jgi:hypothetical protein
MVDLNIFMSAHNLVQEWEGKENHRIPAHVITDIFTTHNRIFPDKPEYSKGCGGCRQRTWNRLKTWYHENKHLYGY